MPDDFRYVLDLITPGGEAVTQVGFEPDFEPARQSSYFEACRAGRDLPPGVPFRARIWPVWHTSMAAPYVEGFRVRLSIDGTDDVECGFSTAYFEPLVHDTTARLLRDGTLRQGMAVRYRVAAFARDAAPEQPTTTIVASELTPDLHIRERDLDAASATRCHGSSSPDADGPPVFVARQVVTSIRTHALRETNGRREAGGVLLGHLQRDRNAGLVAQITGQIEAAAPADAKSITFTPDTWTDLRRIVGLRARGERILGWWHSHPARQWCGECAPDRQRGCALARGFLSAEDRMLHRAVFPAAYSVALVATDSIDGVGFDMFGWRQGVIAPRGFWVWPSHAS